MKFLASFVVLSSELSFIVADCIDIYGKSITPNAHFIPGPDICQLCVCDNTVPKWCKRVLCSPPQNCKSFVMGSSCCDYSCLDNTLPNGELRDEIDRRFLITIATAFFILTILLFVIHKLRSRTIHERLQTRPLNEDRRSIGSIGFITGSIGYLNLPSAPNFDDHPIVHFPIYKPNGYYPRGEAPPPYEEAMADARLASYAEIEMLSHERCLQDPSYQRRRNQLLNLPAGNHPVVTDTAVSCSSEPRPGENGVFIEDSAISDNSVALSQHRTIPLPLCTNSERSGCTADSVLFPHRTCVRKKNNDSETDRVRSNSTDQRRPCTSGSRPNTCPPQLQLEVSSLDGVSIPQSLHRTLPLSASLSSPLPSTSDADRQDQFADIVSGPNFSSATNIRPPMGDDQTVVSAALLTSKMHHPKMCKKALQKASLAMIKCSKERRMKSSNTREPMEPNGNKEVKEESHEGCPMAGDYYAECENCNLNAGANSGDVSDEYFSKQETMTLQRKLHEVSVAQTMDKVSLTLPTNSRTRRRVSSKMKKYGGLRHSKESPCRGTPLEFVSSEDECEEEVPADANPELSVDGRENADEGA